MANMYDNKSTPICSSFSEPTDDISILLHQIISKSSSSSSSSPFSSSPKQMQCDVHPQQVTHLPNDGGVANVPVSGVANVSASSSMGTTIDYEQDEYDCDSEEGFEHLMEEMVTKQNLTRNPSKRTRAAEVHNMSEKRRRSRINEKMKALQKLIPNSNKTDKASMLDEAIEYLKQLQLQLQLQVQMLTVRNEINVYSTYAPHGVLQPNHGPGVTQGNQPINVTADQETPVNPMLGVPVQCANKNQPSILGFSRAI